MIRLYLYFTRRRESINSISHCKNFNYFFWITFLRNSFELDGNTTFCWSSLSHPIFFTSGICFWQVLLCQSFFTGTRAFVVNVQTSVMHPSVTIYRPQCSCICRFFLCTQSIRNHFPDLQQVIPRQYCIHNTYFFHWYFPFFFFHFLGVSCTTFPVDVSKNDCSDSLPDWKSFSLPFVW